MVDTKRLEQSSCPTGTLTVKHRQVGRSFRPTASIRNLNNLIRTGEVAHISYHAGNEVHIFCKGSTVVSSGCNGYRTVEKTESTGNIRHTIDCGPSHLTNQVGTHVFEVLEKAESEYAEFSRLLSARLSLRIRLPSTSFR